MKTKEQLGKEYAFEHGPLCGDASDLYKAYIAGWNGADVDRWIPVTEELPAEHQHVVIRTIHGVMMSAEHITDSFGQPAWLKIFGIVENVTHWHPFPTLPEELSKPDSEK